MDFKKYYDDGKEKIHRYYIENKTISIIIIALLFIGIILLIVFLVPKSKKTIPILSPSITTIPLTSYIPVETDQPEPVPENDNPVEPVPENDNPVEPVPENDNLNSFEKSMLNYHNQLRGKCSPNKKTLVWDNGLAAYAQNYATKLANNGCILSHTFGGHDSYKDKSAGENLAMSQGYSKDQAIKNAINGWAGEGYGKDATGSMTGHYTAMMWKDTSKIGCGIGQKGDCYIISCNYSSEAPNSVLLDGTMTVDQIYDSKVECTKPFSV